MIESHIDLEMLLRGAVAGLLFFHIVHLALPGARAAARAALAMFTLSVLAYVFCQQADVLLGVPLALRYMLMALCVSSTAWMWVAARALFDDHFVLSAPVLGAALALAVLGLAAYVPQLPEAAGTASAQTVVWLSRMHAVAMLAFTGAALWEIARGRADDLVEPRRAVRRWVAMGIGLYAAVALVIELALRGQPIGRLLPALHIAAIGTLALSLALLVARRSLDVVLGTAAAPDAAPPLSAPPDPVLRDAPAAAPPRAKPGLERLHRAMDEEHLYRREGLTLAGLAQALGTGEAALRGLINQELGYRNFNDFLHHYRLLEAAQRLAVEELPVLSIALGCGYGSIGPFNRAFRHRFGMTPSEFRGASRLARGAAAG